MRFIILLFICIVIGCFIVAVLQGCAMASEFSDYKEWAYVNGYGVIYRVNGTGHGWEPDGGMEWFPYTTKEALLAKWQGVRPPMGIYAYYSEHRFQQGYTDNGTMIFIE